VYSTFPLTIRQSAEMLPYDNRQKIMIVMMVFAFFCREYMRQLHSQHNRLILQTLLLLHRRRRAARNAAMMACFAPEGLGCGLLDPVVQKLKWCATLLSTLLFPLKSKQTRCAPSQDFDKDNLMTTNRIQALWAHCRSRIVHTTYLGHWQDWGSAKRGKRPAPRPSQRIFLCQAGRCGDGRRGMKA